MKDRMHDGSAPGWRQTLDLHHTALLEDLTAQLDAEIESSRARERERAEAELARAVSEERTRAGNESRRRLSESLNQTLRRMRQTTAEHEALQLLLEDSAACSELGVVLLIENNQARIAAWRGTGLDEDAMRGEQDGAAIDLSEAAAIASCVESRDLVVALAAPAEISSVLASTMGGSEVNALEKVYLFPVTVRRKTVALLVASGQVTPAPIELLCEATGMRLESFEAVKPAAPAPSFIQIAGARAPERDAEGAATTWSKLTPEQQALHLRAQRTARVRVAQIRISESDALRRGVQAGGIYTALQTSIDAARSEFAQSYMKQSPTMVDYLHLEIMRSLAHDDSSLLGQEYPGPIT